jgi:hypothetical protein
MDLNIATFGYMFLLICPFILVCFFTLSSIFSNDVKGIVYLIGLLAAVGISKLLSTIIPGITDGWPAISVLIAAFTAGLSGLFGYIVSDQPGTWSLWGAVGGFLISGIALYNEWITGLGLNMDLITNPPPICNTISFGNNDMSGMPIGEIIISFTFFYLLTTILSGKNPVLKNYWPTIAFFSILSLADIYINTNIRTMFNSSTESTTDIDSYCHTWHTSVLTYAVGGGLGALWATIVFASNTPALLYIDSTSNNEKCDAVTDQKYKCVIRNVTKDETAEMIKLNK